MSSMFLDRLERELLDGMERHERRWRVRRWLLPRGFGALALAAAAAAVVSVMVGGAGVELEREAVPAAPPAPPGVAGSWRKHHRPGGDDLRGSVQYDGGQQLVLSDDRWRVYDGHQEAAAAHMSGPLRWRGDVMLIAPSGSCAGEAAYRVTRQRTQLRVVALREPCGQRRSSLVGRWRALGG